MTVHKAASCAPIVLCRERDQLSTHCRCLGGSSQHPEEVPSLRHPHSGVLLPPAPPQTACSCSPERGASCAAEQEGIPDPTAAGAGTATAVEMALTARQHHTARLC